MDPRDNDESAFDCDENTVEGCHWIPFERVVLLKTGRPIFDIDDLVRDILTLRINRYDAARKVDWHLDRLIHMRLGADIIMGEFLTYLKKQGVASLGYRTIGTFSVEHLSFSGRLASEMMHNYEALQTLPLTKEAYLQGEIMKSALRYASRIMTPHNEAEWLKMAQSLSLNDLEREVKQALEEMASAEEDAVCDENDGSGKNSKNSRNSENKENGENRENGEGRKNSHGTQDITRCEPDFPSEESDEEMQGVMMDFRVSHTLALIWDFALQHFRDKEHYSGPVSMFVDALLAGWSTSGNRAPVSPLLAEMYGNLPFSPEKKAAMYGDRLLFPEKKAAMYGDRLLFPEKNESVPIFYRCHMKPEEDGKISRLKDLEPLKRTDDDSTEEGSVRAPWRIFFPLSFYKAPGNVREAAETLIECALMRQCIDVAMGKLLRAMRDGGLCRILECSCIEEYGIRHCDLSKPLLYRLMKLANGLERHPLIKDAFESGYISKEQARLILRIADKKNERAWIDYAAHVPTVNLQEEVERCRRIKEYDCLAAGYYAILPGFRYITDDRFHELPEDIQDIIRTGAWYQGPSMQSSWPLEEDDEQDVMDRDRRMEKPWNYFSDVDEFLLYEAETSEMRERKRRHDSRAGQGISGLGDAAAKCATLTGQEIPGPGDVSFKCATLTGQEIPGPGDVSSKCATLAGQGISGQGDVSSKCTGVEGSHTGSCRSCPSPLSAVSAACITELPSKHSQAGKTTCSCCSRHDSEMLSRAREICTVPHGTDPAETFLMDILADDNSSPKGGGGMSIRFFLPDELYELWNMTAMNWLMQAVAEEAAGEKVTDTKEITVEEVNESPMRYIGYAEGFLAALLQDWLLTERLHFKVSRSYAILKRDRFQCQVPGCRCRRNLQIHHIIWRSKGGSDYDFNLITLCKAHHQHILHDLMALKIEGTAPYNLTFTFGSHSSDSDGPFLIYHKGRKKVRNTLNTVEHSDVSGKDLGESL
ncbi:MAG: HNH endonuclease [Candidatus Xenobiia bacterium LiM19]